MKNFFFIGIIYGLLFQIPSLLAANYFKAVFMDIKVAEKKWGREVFNAEGFKIADSKKKSAMAVDLILSKKFVGKSILNDVRRELGRPDKYFFSDTIIAYEIESLEDPKSESWEIVFIPVTVF